MVEALFKVKYGWKLLGRDAQEGRVVLVDVGCLKEKTWMTMVGMLA